MLSLLSWTLLCAEILFASASDHTMPEFLRKENANQVPANALWLSNGLIQLFLIITLFSEVHLPQPAVSGHLDDSGAVLLVECLRRAAGARGDLRKRRRRTQARIC